MLPTSILAASLVLGQQPLTAPRTITVRPAPFLIGSVQNEKRISVRFNDASLKDVLNHLQKQKIDFAVDSDQFKDRRLTLNLTDVPLSTALAAIAGALDAHWEAIGAVRVLKKGPGLGFRPDVGGLFQDGKFRTFMLPDVSKRYWKPENLSEKDFAIRANEKAIKALERAQKDFETQKFEFKKLDDEVVKKALEKAQALHDKELRSTFEKAYTMGCQDINALLKSITPTQKELAKKQGYLKLSDLTVEQRKLAGVKGDGKIEITITRDNETLKIKGE